MSESGDNSCQLADLLADKLFEYCKSDDISEEGIHEIIERHKASTPDNNHEVSDCEFLHQACGNEKVTEGIIQCLLEYFPHVALYDIDDEGLLPIHYACKNSKVSTGIIQLLIDAAPDSVRLASNYRHVPLHCLCANSELNEATALEILKLILEKDPESSRLTDRGSHLPIHIAAFHNVTKSPDFFRVLIEAYPGSERIADDGGMLPFHHACMYNTVEAVEYWYNVYPDAINHVTRDGFYPIHTAICNLSRGGTNHHAISFERHDKTEALKIVKFLLDCDPNVKFQEFVEGESLLHYACRCNYGKSNAAIGIIEGIYDAQPEFIRMEDNEGKLPLHICASSPRQDETAAMEIMKLLLAKYPESIRHAEKDGYLPIHFAAMSKSPEFCSVLIDAYPGSERITGHLSGMLPLHCACLKNSVDTVEYLYNLYPDAINHATSNGLYPIQAAIGTLAKGGGHPNPGAAVEVVKFLLHRDPNIKFQEVQGQSLLAYAVSFDYEGNNEAALRIFEAICDAHPELIRKENNDGRLPLHKLCANSSQDNTTTMAILGLLLEKYPESIQRADNEGLFPIHIAAMANSNKFCRVLIEAYPGSERMPTTMGMLPFHYACMSNTVDTVEYLYNLYPDAIHESTSFGAYPIHLAIHRVTRRVANSEAAVDIVKFLLNCDPRVKFQKLGERYPSLLTACFQNYNDTNVGFGLEITKAIYDADPEAIGDDNIVSNLQNRHPTMQAFINSQLPYFHQAKDEDAMTTPDENDNGHLPLHTALQLNVRLGSIKLLVKGNPLAVRAPDNDGALPLHVACICHESTSVVEYLIDFDTATLGAVDHENNTSLHYACNGAKYETIALLLDKYDAVSISKRNAEGKLPIDVLCESDEVVVFDRRSVEYTECLFRLLRAYPETVMNCM